MNNTTTPTTTTITAIASIYIRNYENKAIGPKEFKEEVESRAEELKADNDHFSEWLSYDQNLTAAEIFHLTAEQRSELLQEYAKHCLEDAEEELLEDTWFEQEVEVEIEIKS